MDELRCNWRPTGPSSGRIGFELLTAPCLVPPNDREGDFQARLRGNSRGRSGPGHSLGRGSISRCPRHHCLPTKSARKASVVLRLRTGRTVSAAEVDGIVALVS